MNSSLDELTADLNGDDVSTRWRTVETIGRIDGDDALDVLIQALTHSDSGVRWRAAEGIGRYKNRKAVYPLIEVLLYDDKQVVCGYAATALVDIGDKRAIHPLRLRGYYGAMGKFGQAAVPELLDAFNSMHIIKIARGQWDTPDMRTEVRPRWLAMNKMMRDVLRKLTHLGNDFMIVQILESLGWKPQTLDERIAVAIFSEDTTTLVRIGKAVVPALINLINSHDTCAIVWQTGLAAKALRQINSPEARAAVEAWEQLQMQSPES